MFTFVGGASATGFGANDDSGKFLGGGSGAYYGAMTGSGLKQNVMTIRWDPSSPTSIPTQNLVAAALTQAKLAGVEVVFAVYPFPLTNGVGTPEAFAAWLTSVALVFPEIKTFIVGNEPNLSTFWRPQWNGSTQASAATFGPFLAAGYDALKGVSPSINVLGVGLSPRGNDAPDGSPSTTSPVRWLKAFGDWYRASGRSKPLMDGFSFHPYPNPSDFSVGFDFSYQWPNGGVQDLARIKQALVDAFRGTAQPTPSTGLTLTLDEVGWQIDTSARGEYAGSENVTVTSEANQADIYRKLVRFVQCDPLVVQLNFFGFYDDRDRSGWQSGLHWANGSARAAANAVKEGIAAGCAGGGPAWSASSAVNGAAVELAGASANGVSFRPTAGEDYSLTSAVYPTSASKAAIAAGTGAIGETTIAGKAYLRPPVALNAKLTKGSYVVGLTFSAWANAGRTTTIVSKPFAVAAGATGAKAAKPAAPAKPAKAKPAKPAKAKPVKPAKPAKPKGAQK